MAQRHRLVRLAAVAAVAVVGAMPMLAGCGMDNNRDLKNVPNVHPDYIVNILNMDKQPNIALLCYHGLGFYTTTRSYDAINRVAELDPFCATKEK